MKKLKTKKSVKLLLAMPELSVYKELHEMTEVLWVEMGKYPIASYEILTAKADRFDTTEIDAAIISATLGTILIDDVVDHDQTKPDHGMTEERRLNLGCALLIAGSQLIMASKFPAEVKIDIQKEYNNWLLDAAEGQELEARGVQLVQTHEDVEKHYWQAVRGKSSQQVGSMFRLGTVMAQRPEFADSFYEVGVLIGDMKQIKDDLSDALFKEVSPDWDSPGKNLLILFCHHPNHPKREEFLSHFERVTKDPVSHRICREIMIETGALGYAIYHLYDRYRKAQKLFSEIEGVDTTPLEKIAKNEIVRVSHEIKKAGIKLPDDLANPMANA